MIGRILDFWSLASDHTVTINVSYNVPGPLNIANWHLNYGTYIFISQMRALFIHNVPLLQWIFISIMNCRHLGR